jgi:hypothetical protein
MPILFSVSGIKSSSKLPFGSVNKILLKGWVVESGGQPSAPADKLWPVDKIWLIKDCSWVAEITSDALGLKIWVNWVR